MLAPYLGDYGYGWYIKKTSAGDKLIYHNGHLGGYSTSIEKNIDKRYTIIILNNISSDEYNMNHMLSGISDILEMKK